MLNLILVISSVRYLSYKYLIKFNIYLLPEHNRNSKFHLPSSLASGVVCLQRVKQEGSEKSIYALVGVWVSLHTATNVLGGIRCGTLYGPTVLGWFPSDLRGPG